jgi:ribonuclease D
MTSVPYRFLDRPEEIRAFLSDLGEPPSLALDLEADSLHSYREKACLIQLSTETETAILDPLPDRQALERLGSLLANPAVQKVFHGGDYDVRLLKRDFGFQVTNLFDTMIAGQLTGREQLGLAALLEEHFGVRLDKKHQRADWSARPLRAELLAYAALDTAYLLELKLRLEADLTNLGRLHWAAEEFRLLEGVEPGAPKTVSCFDVKGATRLKPKQLALLQRLLEARDELAREWDRPPFKVIAPQILVAWAEQPPSSRKEILESPGASKPALARLASEILDAVRAVEGLPSESCPQAPVSAYVPMTGGQERRLKRLKRARSSRAEQLRLSPGLLVNSATLERLARLEPEDGMRALPNFLKNWQREAIGPDLDDALRGGSAES